jgi:hypothetical protein
LVLVVVGLVWRLYGIDGSLRQDEFGTLWVVEGDLGTAWTRTLAWQAQTPFYYLLAWAPYHLLGPSEWALRSSALVFGALTAVAGAFVGRELGGRRAALGVGLLLWLDPFLLVRSTNARPYLLGTLCVALLLAGFLRACRRGDGVGRALFVAGGVSAFYAHFFMVLPAIGLAVAYALDPRLRERYPWRRFAFDVGLQLLLVLPALPQLFSLGGRSHLWTLPLSVGWVARVLAGTLAVPLALGAWGAWRGERARERELRPFTLALLAAALAPVLVLGLGALVTHNGFLFSHRYLAACVVPAAILGGVGLALLGRREALVLGGCWLVLLGAFFSSRFAGAGSFNGIGGETWREAVATLRAETAGEERPLVLYRSGFMDDDLHLEGRHDEATRAPLTSPGEQAPPWEILGLTHSWGREGHERFLEEQVLGAVRGRRHVYLLVKGGGYAERLEAWLGQRLSVTREEIPAPGVRGVTLRRLRLGPR